MRMWSRGALAPPLYCVLLACCVAACSDDTTIEQVAAECSAAFPQGICPEAGHSCLEGSCVDALSLCSVANNTGACATGYSCLAGGCVAAQTLCSAETPSGHCELGLTCVDGECLATESLCSTANPAGQCPAGQACQSGLCAGTSVAVCQTPIYDAQPELGIHSTASGKVLLAVDDLQFKDLNGSGELEPYEDWRLPELCRARDLAARLSISEKIALMSESVYFGSGTQDGSLPESVQDAIQGGFRYSMIQLGTVSAAELAAYANALQEMAEGQPYGIPVTLFANPSHSFGLTTNASTGAQSLDANPTLSPWPTQLGLGAIGDTSVTQQYAEIVREEFKAMGLRVILGPFADLATEPRWGRQHELFGSSVYATIHQIHTLVHTLQNEANGGLRDGLAATVKHFPGAGPNESGLDSHTYPGRYNVYPGGNLAEHLLPFQAAIDAGAAAVMPCYSIIRDLPEYNPEQLGAAFSHTLITKTLKQGMGFDGVVTADYGTLAQGYNLELLTLPQRAAIFLNAGSHQLGLDLPGPFQEALELGYVQETTIDEAVAKILELTFKLGLFENPYVDAEAATLVRSNEHLAAGFEAQKKAIVIAYNRSHEVAPPPPANIFYASVDPATPYLPIDGSRYTDSNDNGSPDTGEYICDTNGDSSVRVYYDGVWDGLTANPDNPDPLTAQLGSYDYTSGGGDSTLPIAATSNLADADIAIIRIAARTGTYLGLDAGIPLSFDGPFPGEEQDTSIEAAITDRNKVIDALRVRDGYTDADGNAVAAENPSLRIVLVMYTNRPGIVEPFIRGLSTLDETPGSPNSYPLVSDTANHDPDGRSGVDALLLEFGAYDRAVLDVVFNVNPIEGWAYGSAKLPIELPSSDEAVAAQYEDVAADSLNPTFRRGSGLTY